MRIRKLNIKKCKEDDKSEPGIAETVKNLFTYYFLQSSPKLSSRSFLIIEADVLY